MSNIFSEIHLEQRPCDCCSKNNVEVLWKYEFKARTRNKSWLFNVNNVICRHCGFVYVSPVYKQQDLIEYYADSFSKNSIQKIDYSISKRIELIKKFITEKCETYVEIGSKQKTDFHNQLHDLFQEIITIEPNNETDSELNDINKLNRKADLIAHYFVLEHVSNLDDFFNQVTSNLKENGYVICEVPSLKKYYKHISPLILFEHVNHFTEESLNRISSKYGLKQIFTSDNMCSRDFGFVSVFKKSTEIETFSINEFDENKDYFLNGLETYKDILNLNNHVRDFILSNEKNHVLIWAINSTTLRLLNEFEPKSNLFFVDVDARKKDFLSPKFEVYQPNEIGDFTKFTHLIICTEINAPNIIDELKVKYDKVFDNDKIFIIDKI